MRKKFVMRTTLTVDPLVWRIVKGDFGPELAEEVTLSAMAEYYAALMNMFGALYFQNVNPRTGRYIRSSKALRALVAAYNLAGIQFGLVGQSRFDEFMLRLLDRGGVVRPTSARLLAIPLTKEAEKLGSPREVRDGFWIRTGEGKILFGRRAVLNRRAAATIRRFGEKQRLSKAYASAKPKPRAQRRARPRRATKRVTKKMKRQSAEERARFVRTRWNPYQFSPMFLGVRRVSIPPKRFWRNTREEFWTRAQKIGQARLAHGIMKAMKRIGRKFEAGAPRSVAISLAHLGVVRRGGEIKGLRSAMRLALGYRAMRAPVQHIKANASAVRDFANDMAAALERNRRDAMMAVKLFHGAQLRGVLELRTKAGYKRLLEFKLGGEGRPRLIPAERVGSEIKEYTERLMDRMLVEIGRAVETLAARYPKFQRALFKDLERMQQLAWEVTEYGLERTSIVYPEAEKERYGLLRLFAQIKPLLGSEADIRRSTRTIMRNLAIHGDWVLTKFLNEYVSKMTIAVPRFVVSGRREMPSEMAPRSDIERRTSETWQRLQRLWSETESTEVIDTAGPSMMQYLARTTGRELATFKFRGYNIVRLRVPKLVSPESVEKELRRMLRRAG